MVLSPTPYVYRGILPDQTEPVGLGIQFLTIVVMFFLAELLAILVYRKYENKN